MTARSFVWLSLTGGAWSLASNWADVTDGTSPSLVAPGSQDSVTVGGPTGAQIQTITGNATVAAGLFTGNTLLLGGFSAGALTLGGVALGGLLQLGRGTSLLAGTASIASGSMVAGPGSTLSVSGTMSLGAGGGAAALDATGGGAVSVLAMLMTSADDSIYVDPTSIVEVGSAGSAPNAGDQAGCLTIDAGASLAGQGSADAFGNVVNNGTLAAAGGTLTVGALSGIGTLQIGADATLALNGACGPGQAVAFSGANATLAIDEEFFAPSGTVSGLAAGDAIDMRGSTISAASYAGGVLTLSYDGQVAVSLQLSGNYAGCIFLTSGDGEGGTLITVTQGSGVTGGTSPGTTNPDQYAWIASGSGAWNRAANWQDLTTGATPAAIAPGGADLVTVVASQTMFSELSGNGNAASLTLEGEVALSGAHTLGTLTVGQTAGADFTAGALDQLAGTAVSAASAWVAAGAISIAGSGCSLSVAGTLTLGGGVFGVGLPMASLQATAGGSVRAASLVMGGGSGASLTTDDAGVIEVGAAGGAQPGAVTVDAGAMLAGNGDVNPYGSIVDNGTILASGGTLSLGAVSGAGSLVIAAGATLELVSATAAPIALQGTASSGSTLALTSARAAPTGTLTGFSVGDVIHLEGSSLTSVQLQQSGASGTLLLIYGTTTVARIALAGLVGAPHFIMTPDGTDGTEITVDVLGGGGGAGGQTGTDQLAWASPASGGWNRAANWTDVTTGKVATLAPAAQTPVLITGPGGYNFQSIAGPGGCASVTFLGNTALGGAITTGQLIVGQASTQGSAALAGAVDVNGATTLTASQGVLTDGQILCIGSGGLLSVTGTLALGGTAGAGQQDALLDIGGHAGGQLGGLSLGGGGSAVTVDSTAWLEVGTAGGAASGVLTVDAGSVVSGNGALNAYGLVSDNGTILAQGGTLMVGAVAGSGSLAIDTEATLALAGASSCGITFIGGGATLLLPVAGLPTGVISGFGFGDSIVSTSPVDTLSFQPNAGGAGTLSLWAAGNLIGQLALAGNYAGDSFSAQPDAAGAAIVLTTQVFTGPPPGTVSPDSYIWTGAAGSAAWSTAGNWTDATQGAGAAFQPPGQNDLVSVAGGNGTALALTGPADAASLSISGTVALAGAFAVGTLAVGAGQGGALLAIGSGASLSAAAASVAGGIAVGAGTLSVSSMLTLAAGGVLAVSNLGTVQAGLLTLGGDGSAIAVDAGSAVEIGGASGAAAGSITVDAGGVLQGAGVVGLSDQVIDQGSIVASGGTLVLGPVSGSGTLLTGVGADLVLQGAVAAGLTADFAGAGTLDLTGAAGSPTILDFGTGDSILLPVAGAASATYAVTAPGSGQLSIFDPTGQILTQLTLLGSQAGRAFTVAGIAGGGTILTNQPDSSGPGGTTMTYPPLASGTMQYGEFLNDVATGFPYVSQDEIAAVTFRQTMYLDFSTDGLPSAPYFGGANGPGANIEVVAPLSAYSGSGVGPGSVIALQPGYDAVLLEGTEPLALTDWDGLAGDGPAGNVLLAGNYGNDTIVASGDGDTLVGATGANTLFYAHLVNANGGTTQPVEVYVQGGGNDTINTTQDNADITTSVDSSLVFLASNNNSIVSNGSDTIICAGVTGNDTIQARATAGHAGDLIFAGGQGYLNFIGGDAPSTVIGQGLWISMQGGSGNGSVIFAGQSSLNYFGGAGSATIICGGDQTNSLVQGGSGAMTVFGGTGSTTIRGAAGNSVFVVGAGASTVNAVAGNTVYAVGAANVTINASGDAVVYAGSSTGNDELSASSGQQVLWGGTGTDLFTAGTGPDVMISGGGRDVFSFGNNGFTGTDVIYGFQAGQDKIDLSDFGSQLPQITSAFGSEIVHLQSGAQILVANVSNLTSQNFILT